MSKIVYNNCSNYFKWLIFVHQRISSSERGCFPIVWQLERFIFVHPMDISTIESCCAQLECFEHNRMLLCAHCGFSLHAAGILWHSVVSKMYYFVYAHWCLQHPMINKLNIVIFIASYLSDFTLLVSRFSIQVGERGVIHFCFPVRVGHSFYNFLQCLHNFFLKRF